MDEAQSGLTWWRWLQRVRVVECGLILERWLSGRKREFAKFVTGLTGPQVRILSSPLVQHRDIMVPQTFSKTLADAGAFVVSGTRCVGLPQGVVAIVAALT